jgi:Tol biopolymer transport system component
MVSKPSSIKVINLGDTINSEYADYGPVLTADQQMLIFTSARPNTTGGEIDESDGRYYEDIYISYKLNSGWTAPLGIGPGINTNGHDASISLSPDGQKLLIYRYDQDLLSSGIPGDLYVSKLKGTTWTNATKLPQSINTRAWEPSACYSADERSLFFSSNREGGKGGTDLYMVRQLPNGEWALPMNLGDKLNTPFDEDSPFIHPDGKTLYFSSNGHKTMGGYDIFVSRYDDEKKEWSTPENLGYPINTAHDDIHFTLTADGRRVYFSSIRPEGKGDNDIYYADMNTEAADVVVIKGIVSDSVTKQPKEALIIVYDTNTNELIGKYNSNSSTGKYIIILSEGRKYNITVEAEKYILHFENFDASKLKGFEEKEKNISLSPKK